MTKDEIKAEIRRRMEPGPFRYLDLHAGLPHEASRLADQMIQKRRKSGEIAFKRVGGIPIWEEVRK